MLITLADLAANMIGRSNARRGARRIFAVLQNRRLNQHLVYTIVDEVRQCHSIALLEKLNYPCAGVCRIVL